VAGACGEARQAVHDAGVEAFDEEAFVAGPEGIVRIFDACGEDLAVGVVGGLPDAAGGEEVGRELWICVCGPSGQAEEVEGCNDIARCVLGDVDRSALRVEVDEQFIDAGMTPTAVAGAPDEFADDGPVLAGRA
jgi:hypothetical protein